MQDIISVKEFHYHWQIENGLAVLYQVGMEPWKYNLCKLRLALRNVIHSRAAYATQTEWERQVQMFGNGLALLENHKLAHEDQKGEMSNNETKKPAGILLKLSPDERETLREVCNYARAFAVDFDFGPRVAINHIEGKIRELLGEETE